MNVPKVRIWLAAVVLVGSILVASIPVGASRFGSSGVVAAVELVELSEAEGGRFVAAIEAITKTHTVCNEKGCDWIHLDKEKLFNIQLEPDRSAPITVKFVAQQLELKIQRTYAFVYWPPKRLLAGGFITERVTASGKVSDKKFTELKGDLLRNSVIPLIEMLECLPQTLDE